VTINRDLGWVAGAGLAAVAILMVIWTTNIGKYPPCADMTAVQEEREESGDPVVTCFDGSQGRNDATVATGWASAGLAGIAALVALFFAATGRRRPLLLRLAGVALALGGLSLLLGSI
jgi:ABC-type Fe3+-siderophore transport system permease subunit